jgi:hypothetical protein
MAFQILTIKSLVAILLFSKMSGDFQISDLFLEKARVELGENESTKKEGLEKLRAWIKSQTWIKKCRDGEDIRSQLLLS